MLLLYSILIGLFFGLGRSHTCSWKNCPNVDASEGVINVHIVPHTHDDLGWIKTVDEYFFGTNNHLVPVGVNYIFDSVIDSLHKDPSRKFSFAETGFLWRWMETHDDKQKQRFTNLLNNGQIEIIGGGFVQNDEASAHYVDIIDQMTLGLRYLNETFGECGKPKVAWQIDPFGHSIEMASIFSQMDYEALYFAREHYLEHKQRIQDKTLEFIWNSSQDLKTSILTGVFYLSTYAPLKDFCFDSLCQDDSIIDNKNFPGYNLDVKLKAFIEHIYKQVSVQRHNNILFSAGGDFQYSDANHWFVNLDKLIYHVQKQFPNIKIFYSTPSCYIQSLKSFKPNLTTKTSDFFPYAHRNNTYWTGYFTSKPTQKRMIRQSSTLNNLIKKLSAVTRLNNSPQTLMSKKLQRASALNQHHDAVTGTSKSNVTFDYEDRLIEGWQESAQILNNISTHLNNLNHTIPFILCTPTSDGCFVQKINETSESFMVTVYHGHHLKRDVIIKIPLNHQPTIVTDDQGNNVKYQVVLSGDQVSEVQLVIQLTLPRIGFKTYFVGGGKAINKIQNKFGKVKSIKNGGLKPLENDLIKLEFDSDGYLKTFTNKMTNLTMPFSQHFSYYPGNGKEAFQQDGAYIFAPSTNSSISFNDTIKSTQYFGDITNQTQQIINPWISQTISLSKSQEYIDFTFTIGPIPKEKIDPIAKDIVTTYITNIHSQNKFTTDCNGRQTMVRTLNSAPDYIYLNEEPVAGNYYPITTSISLEDGVNSMACLVDRAEGGSSLKEGALELMVHRRAFADDHLGVEEPLDEEDTQGNGLIMKGTHRIYIGQKDNIAAITKRHQIELFNEPILTYAPWANKSMADYKKSYKSSYEGLANDLPDGVNLLTLETISTSPLIWFMRVERYIEGGHVKIGEEPMTVNVASIFPNFSVKKMVEVNLQGTTFLTDKKKLLKENKISKYSKNVDPSLVYLYPMQIRSFYIYL